MKKYLLLTTIILNLIFPRDSFGHAIGQPPYFKVNGSFTELYPVPTISVTDFELPQDSAPGVFLVGEEIRFEIDKAALPVPAEVIEKTKFIWEYGDGSKAEGLNNTYAYRKPGTYFLDIYADSEGGFEPQLLQSTAINIVPDRNYQLPKAVIEVNGKQTKDPLLDIIDVNFSKEIGFDGSKSRSGSSEITEYFWDLGDANSRRETSFKYDYSENPYTVFPVLRIKTRDGFIADSFIQIKDESAFGESSGALSGLKSNWILIAGIVVVSLILAGILTWIISKFWFKK